MSKNIIISIGLAVAILFAILYVTYVVDDTDTSAGLTGDISIGTLLPITGDLSSQGEGDKTAINLAAEDFNEYLDKNNANWRLKIVHEDSATNPVIALEKVTSLHAKNIDLVVGPTSSGELRNIMGYVNSNGMLLFSQSSTAPSLAIPGDTVFRLTPDDTKQGPAIAALLDDNNIDSIIQLVRADAWGDGLSKTIEESFLDEPEHVSQIIRYNSDSPEFSVTTSLLAKAVQDQVIIHGTEKVGVVIIGFAETLQFMQSATEHEILDDVRWFGTDGSTNDNKITNDPLGLEFAEKVQFSTTLLAVSDNDIRKDVEQRIVSQIGKTPKSYAFSAYDIVWILGLAMLEVDSNDVEKITPIISDVAAGYNGAIGNARLNEAGDLDTSNYDIWQVSNDSWNIVGYYDSDKDTIFEISVGTNPEKMGINFDEDKYSPEHKSEAQFMVEQAIADYSGYGSGAFSDYATSEKYHDGEHYVFVIRMSDNVYVAHGNRPDLIGTMITDLVDTNGVNIGQLFINNITLEGAWVEYHWENPTNNQMSAKLTWIKSFDGYIFAVGTYAH